MVVTPARDKPMHITIQIKSVYGVNTVYPACPKSVIFAAIAGTKTLTHATLCQIEALGYEIKAEAPVYTRAK